MEGEEGAATVSPRADGVAGCPRFPAPRLLNESRFTWGAEDGYGFNAPFLFVSPCFGPTKCVGPTKLPCERWSLFDQ